MSDKPNFLFIITDQHRADWLGCYGHPVVKTPNIDAIASAGVRFDNFFVASPVCMPNRASLMTGRMPSLHGLRYNGCQLPKSANTFVDVLSAGGYHTASIGKSHLQPFTETEPIRKNQRCERAIEEAWKDDGMDYQLEQPANYRGDAWFDFETPYYGFQQVDMVTSHGDKCGGHYFQWLKSQCTDWQELHDPKNELPHNYSCPQAFRTPVPEELYPTTYIANRAIEHIEERSSLDQPFFAFISFPDPHHPFNPPGKYWDMYSPDEFTVELPFEAHNNPTPPMQYLDKQFNSDVATPTPQTAFRASEQHLQQAMALTAGMIALIDDQIGRIVDALKVSGQYENTVIIFTSDHGDYLGDFSLLLKGPMPFRSISQVPMIWSDPMNRSATVFQSLASTIDLSASILDRVGLAPYHGIQGKSFLEAIEGADAHRKELLIEYNDGFSRIGFEDPARVRSLRTSEYVLTVYGSQYWGELYDLRTDNNETQNQWDNEAYSEIKAELLFRLNQQLIEQMDESPRSKRLA